MTDKEREFELIKRAVLILCRNVRSDGDLRRLDWDDRCKMQEIYHELAEQKAKELKGDKVVVSFEDVKEIITDIITKWQGLKYNLGDANHIIVMIGQKAYRQEADDDSSK